MFSSHVEENVDLVGFSCKLHWMFTPFPMCALCGLFVTNQSVLLRGRVVLNLWHCNYVSPFCVLVQSLYPTPLLYLPVPLYFPLSFFSIAFPIPHSLNFSLPSLSISLPPRHRNWVRSHQLHSNRGWWFRHLHSYTSEWDIGEGCWSFIHNCRWHSCWWACGLAD